MSDSETESVFITATGEEPDDDGFIDANASRTIFIFCRTIGRNVEAGITGFNPDSGEIRVMYVPRSSIKNKPVKPKEFAEWNPGVELKIEGQDPVSATTDQ